MCRIGRQNYDLGGWHGQRYSVVRVGDAVTSESSQSANKRIHGQAGTLARATRRNRVCLWLIAATGTAGGCGYSGGKAWFMSGLFKRPTIEAGFEFGEGPVAVLVDDFQEQCYWPGATHLLAEKVVQALLDQNVAKIVIPASHMHQLRQGDPDFDEKSAAAVGRLVNADQLLLLEIRSFDATETPTEASAAARMSVAAKVINVLENNDRAKVRLWPRSHEGEVIEADITAAAITRAKSREAILDELTKALAERVVRRFYDRPMEDFEKG